jgi:hypothetical protein
MVVGYDLAMQLKLMGCRFDTDDELLRHRLREMKEEPTEAELEAIAPGLCTSLRGLRGQLVARGEKDDPTGLLCVEAPIQEYRKAGGSPISRERP